MCDFPENSRCASVCPKSEGFFPVEGDCAAYVKCENFVPTIVSCDEGHYFNVLTSDCEIAKNVSCEPTCPSPNGRFLLPGETGETFVECIDNKPTIKSCSLGLRLNPEAENCE
ncbi:uncharacterized protein [Anabrus simplex]|uniref:uncharacterized protein n=1 Tax=Anabrus simplex TaxID=316456 RepID=UPI0034DD2450